MGRSRFEPTVEELISIYLKNTILGIPYECDHIIDAEMYGDAKTPWEAFGNQLPWQPFVDQFGVRHDSCHLLYVLTCLRNVGKVGTKRKSRASGIGCWSGNSKSNTLLNAKEQKIGYSKSFTYETDQQTQTLGQWTMVEYSINPDAHPELRGKNCDCLVICKIKREDNKYSKGGKLVESYAHQHLRKRPRFTQVDDGEVVNMPIGGVDVASPQIINVEDYLVHMPSGDVDCQHLDVVVDFPKIIDIEDETLVDYGEVVDMQNVNAVMSVDLPEIIDIEDESVDVVDCQGEDWAFAPCVFQGEDLADPNLSFDVPDSWFNVDNFLTQTAGIG